MAEVDWSRLKAHELRKLANENAVVILPIASIEQHGSHLPVMTDTRLGQEIAFRAARKVYEKRPVVVPRSFGQVCLSITCHSVAP